MSRRRKKPRKLPVSRGALTFGAYFLVAVSVAGLALFNSRGEALDRLLGPEDEVALSRNSTLPYLFRMAREHLPFGSGFGSFDALFHQYEQVRDLSPSYLNQAHDDWLQIIIEGGLPAVVLLALFIAWVATWAFVAIRQRETADPRERLGLVAILAMLGVGSLVDYPLRVPIMMMVTAFVICLLGDKLATPARRWHRGAE
jgi:O-antigen ligase